MRPDALSTVCALARAAAKQLPASGDPRSVTARGLVNALEHLAAGATPEESLAMARRQIDLAEAALADRRVTPERAAAVGEQAARLVAADSLFSEVHP